MNCPNCGKELELKQRQVGLDDSNAPIYNEFAICKDCKKMWNLDKQRQKKMTASKTTANRLKGLLKNLLIPKLQKLLRNQLQNIRNMLQMPRRKNRHIMQDQKVLLLKHSQRNIQKNVRLLHMLIQMRTLSETFLRSMFARKRKRQSARVMRKC